MQATCRCAHCGFSVPPGPEGVFEVDFVEREIRFYCPQCRKQNVMRLYDPKKEKKLQSLPPTAILR